MADGLIGNWGRPRRFPPFTMALIGLNVALFILDLRYPLTGHGALSLEGLRHGHVWQFITYQFLHAGPIHLLLNCWGIFVFGPPLEMVLGKARLATLYLVSGIAGGVLQILASLLAREHFGFQVVGASAGVFGLVAAFSSLFPHAQMTVLLFFIIPVRMTAKRMLTVAAIISVVGMIYPRLLLSPNIAHAAHLGGLIGGLVMVRAVLRRFRQ